MSRVMLTAAEARVKSLQDVFVIREIRDIEEEILIASASGLVEVIIPRTTTMAKSLGDLDYALATEYFDAWAGSRDDRQKVLQMEKVLKYFSDLGYLIERQTNPTSNATFQWVVAW